MFLLVLAYLGSPVQKAVKRACVRACVRVCVCVNKDFIVSGVLLSMNVKFFVFDSTRIHIV